MVYHFLPRYIISVDLGQMHDYTAIATLQRTPERLSAEGDYELIDLRRLPLNTPYTAIPPVLRRIDEQVRVRWSSLAAARGRALPMTRAPVDLVLDRTGVGAGVYDLFCAEQLDPIGITITGGDQMTTVAHRAYRVPKRDLAGAVQVLLQTRRLRWPASLPEAATLTSELQNFKAKISLAGHDSYGAGDDWREGNHDDTVLAVAMGVWWGEHQVAIAGRSVVRVIPYADIARDPDDDGEDGLDPVWLQQLTATAVQQRERKAARRTS